MAESLRRSAVAEDLRRSAVAETPALRDDHGQPWPFPPLTDPDGPAGPDPAATSPGLTWLVLLPGAFTPVCTSELAWLSAMAVDLAPERVAVRVLTCDSAPVLRRVRADLGLAAELVLLSDFWPHGAAARALDAFDPGTGRARRVSVLLDARRTEVGRVVPAPGQPRTRAQHEAVLSRAGRLGDRTRL